MLKNCLSCTLKEWLVIDPVSWHVCSDFNTQLEAEQYRQDRDYIIVQASRINIKHGTTELDYYYRGLR